MELENLPFWMEQALNYGVLMFIIHCKTRVSLQKNSYFLEYKRIGNLTALQHISIFLKAVPANFALNIKL